MSTKPLLSHPGPNSGRRIVPIQRSFVWRGSSVPTFWIHCQGRVSRWVCVHTVPFAIVIDIIRIKQHLMRGPPPEERTTRTTRVLHTGPDSAPLPAIGQTVPVLIRPPHRRARHTVHVQPARDGTISTTVEILSEDPPDHRVRICLDRVLEPAELGTRLCGLRLGLVARCRHRTGCASRRQEQVVGGRITNCRPST